MTLFWFMLIANSITLAVSIVAASLKPITSYRLIAAVALCAFLCSLQQVVTARSNPFALLLNLLLVVLMNRRIRANLRNTGRNGKH
jgi:hypothetical protein